MYGSMEFSAGGNEAHPGTAEDIDLGLTGNQAQASVTAKKITDKVGQEQCVPHESEQHEADYNGQPRKSR